MGQRFLTEQNESLHDEGQELRVGRTEMSDEEKGEEDYDKQLFFGRTSGFDDWKPKN